jgi:hypothetical protein
MKIRMLIGAAVMTALLTSVYVMAEEHPMGTEQKAPTTQAVYACPDCHTMALKAGKCSMCGKELMEKHMLGMKDGKVMVCDCPPGCKCDAAGVKDGKCACGKDVKEMSAKGMYMCACPGAKCCTSISDKPGKCACGMDLKKIE